jgi:hypothetical protein
MITIDYTITLGNLIEIGSIIGGGLMVLIKLNNNVVSLKTEVSGMQDEIKKLGDILIAQADIRSELKGLGTRLTTAEQDIREVKHGDGFVRGTRGIDREYK